MVRQEKCIFTGFDTMPILDDRDAVEYRVKVGNRIHLIRLLPYVNELLDDPFFKENKHKFYGLLLNNNWLDNETIFIDIDVLKSLINERYFPKNPKEKQTALFLKLASYQKQDGYVVTIERNYYEEELWRILYFKSLSEMNFYFQHLHKVGLISANYYSAQGSIISPKDYYITIDGLNELINIQESGHNSNNCFVAMAFRDDNMEIRQAIKEVITETGFVPILIDEQILRAQELLMMK